MLPRVLEPEVMDSQAEACDYDSMDHSEVNRKFVADFLRQSPDLADVLDVGAGTAQIPIELWTQAPDVRVLAIDLASWMLKVAQQNVDRAGCRGHVQLELVDAKAMPYPDGRFSAVISNSIVHHIPKPAAVIAEMVRVAQPGAVIYVRDLLRPADEVMLNQLVSQYAGECNEHQQKMFRESLHAALTVDEVRDLVAVHGFSGQSVQATSDRHWTWSAQRC